MNFCINVILEVIVIIVLIDKICVVFLYGLYYSGDIVFVRISLVERKWMERSIGIVE